MLHNPPDVRQVLPQLLWDVMPEQQDDRRFSYQQAPSYTHVGPDGLSSMVGLSEAYNLVFSWARWAEIRENRRDWNVSQRKQDYGTHGSRMVYLVSIHCSFAPEPKWIYSIRCTLLSKRQRQFYYSLTFSGLPAISRV